MSNYRATMQNIREITFNADQSAYRRAVDDLRNGTRRDLMKYWEHEDFAMWVRAVLVAVGKNASDEDRESLKRFAIVELKRFAPYMIDRDRMWYLDGALKGTIQLQFM